MTMMKYFLVIIDEIDTIIFSKDMMGINVIWLQNQ